MKTTGNKWLAALTLLMGCVLFCALEQWFVYDIDDFGFSTLSQAVRSADGSVTVVHNKPIDSLADAIASQTVSYRYYNGRFVIHGLVQWLVGTQPAWVVVILNTVLWAVLVACLTMLCDTRRRVTATKLLITTGVVWLMMPAAAKMFLGSVTAAADYLWTGAVTMLFLVAFDRAGKAGSVSDKAIGGIAAALLALLAGVMQESFSIGISAGLVVYALVHRKHNSPARRMMTACYLLGTALCALAPANFRRADAMGYGLHFAALADAAKTPVFTMMLAAVSATWLFKRAVVKTLIRDNLIVAVAWATNLAFAFFAAYTSAWQLTCVSLCSAVLLMQLFYRLFDSRPAVVRGVAAMLTVAVVMLATVQYQYRRHMWHVQQTMFASALTATDGIVSLHGAFEANRPYARSALAPVFRLYTVNFAKAFVNDNQRCCDAMLSKFLTRCKNPGLVKALLPDSPERIEQRFGTAAFTIGGTRMVACEDYLIARQQPAEGLADKLCREYDFGGTHYYVYMNF